MSSIHDAQIVELAREVLRRNDGVAHIQRFLEAGLTRTQVGRLRHLGAVARPRIGWYADPALPDAALRAITVGGVLACVSAAATWGIATPERHERLLHAHLDRNASRLRMSHDSARRAPADADRTTRWHWGETADARRGWRVSVLDTLLQMADCVEYRWLVAAIDSARCSTHREALLSESDVVRLRELLPERVKRAVDDSDPLAESSGETFIRLGVRAARIPVRSQVWITQLYRADLLVDGWLPIESDGMQNHASPGAVERDRARDACLAVLGTPPLRFSQKQAVRETDFVVDAVRAVWSRGHELRGSGGPGRHAVSQPGMRRVARDHLNRDRSPDP